MKISIIASTLNKAAVLPVLLDCLLPLVRLGSSSGR